MEGFAYVVLVIWALRMNTAFRYVSWYGMLAAQVRRRMEGLGEDEVIYTLRSKTLLGR